MTAGHFFSGQNSLHLGGILNEIMKFQSVKFRHALLVTYFGFYVHIHLNKPACMMTWSGSSGLNKQSFAAKQQSLNPTKEWKERLVQPVSRVTRLLLPFHSVSMPFPAGGILPASEARLPRISCPGTDPI
jgi:hypothetical protein